jgi:hypothetical protein
MFRMAAGEETGEEQVSSREAGPARVDAQTALEIAVEDYPFLHPLSAARLYWPRPEALDGGRMPRPITRVG